MRAFYHKINRAWPLLAQEIVQLNNPSMCGAVLVDDKADREWAHELVTKGKELAPAIHVLQLEENQNAK
jgi:hypothetical protein